MLRLAGLLLLILLTGCSAPGSSAAKWIDRHGGTCEGACDQRLQAIASRLQLARPLNCQVMNDAAPGAFSWRSGRIVVTCGLMQIATDDEIAAAVAHEAGHLIHDGFLDAPAALEGIASPPDTEAAADAIGVQILRASGIDPGAMTGLLVKLRNHIPSRVNARPLDQRIELLRDTM